MTQVVVPEGVMADATVTNEVFAIGRRGKYPTQNFNAFASFIAVLIND